MQLRRHPEPAMRPSANWQQKTGVGWTDLDATDPAMVWLRTLGEPDLVGPGSGLPFKPLSYRDCMLYERHWIDSSRGYARRFLPAAYQISRVYEAMLRSPFPAFRPPGLWHRQPIYYFGNHLTFVPSGTPVSKPDYTQALDYELELAWVLSKPLFNASPEEAEEAIGAFLVLNDFSARDVQRAEMQTGLGPQKSKHFLTTLSRTMTTADDILPRVQSLTARVEINGQTVCETSTAGMKFNPGQVLAHLSRSEHLYPGELIASGTLPGGSGMELGSWIQPGDHLRLLIDGVGEIEHNII
jgi:2-keto-4-pentenoate hydratase/2-oxohepta-3-ene-1,7-dioic acid hydratase in catechol pathway